MLDNGGVIGVSNTPSKTAASGIWSMRDLARAKRDDLWPAIGVDAFNVLLAYFDGPDASTTMPDAAFSPHTLTANGNAQLDTAQAWAGTASLLLDGTGDYVSVPDSNDWDIWGADGTIDLRARWNTLPENSEFHTLVSQGGASSSEEWYFLLTRSGGQLRFSFTCVTGGVGRGAFTANVTLAAGTWYHIALERSGGTPFIYVDGVSQSVSVSTAFGTPANISGSLYIGSRNPSITSTQCFNGWLDMIRISKGVARYGGANFTPPVVAY